MADKAEKNETVGVTVDPKATPVEAGDPVEMPADMGSTFAERAAARNKGSKQVDASENKAVSSSESKSRRKK